MAKIATTKEEKAKAMTGVKKRYEEGLVILKIQRKERSPETGKHITEPIEHRMVGSDYPKWLNNMRQEYKVVKEIQIPEGILSEKAYDKKIADKAEADYKKREEAIRNLKKNYR